MNENIKLLIMKAGGIICSDVATGTIEKIDYLHFDAEKFAELIVGECVNMIEAAAENADEEDVHGMRNAAGLISRAFITFHDADLKNNGTY